MKLLMRLKDFFYVQERFLIIINVENSCAAFKVFWKPWFFIKIFDEYEVQKTAFIWNNIFCNILNIFTVTFDQFNTSLMNKRKV